MPYVVSELLVGESLRERLRGGALPTRKAIEYALQTSRGLAAAHEKGIVHRDLKPENLFLTTDGRMKILEFGLAKLTHPESAPGEGSQAPTAALETTPGTVMGTIGYMSPEQVRARPADHRSDIFSFGAILYEMFTGKRAFHGESAVETMNAILKEDPPELATAGLPLALERIVRRCLEKNPAERFQTASDLSFALDSLTGLSGQTTATTAVGSSADASRSPSRWHRWAALAIILLLGALTGAVLVGRRTAQLPQPEYHQLTFRRGSIQSARFAPDGQTFVYGAAWDGEPMEVFSTRLGSPESRSLGLADAEILSISSTGEMAILLHRRFLGPLLSVGTLARAPFSGGAPREVLDNVQDADWSPDGKELAVVRYEGGRSRLEFPIGKVLYEAPGAISPLRFSPDGRRLAFFERQAGLGTLGLAILDLRSRKKTLLPIVNGTFWGLAWSASGDEIWFTAAETASAHAALYAVTLSGRRRLIARVPGTLALRDLSRDGRVLLIRQDWRSFVTAVPAEPGRERDVSWLALSLLADASPDGKMVLLLANHPGDRDGLSIYLRKTDGSPAVRLGEWEGTFLPALSPDGKWVLAQQGGATPHLALLPTGAGEARTLALDGLSQYYSARCFADGQRVVVMASEPGHGPRLYAAGLTGGKPLPITPEGLALPGTYTVSRDGRFVAARGPDRVLRLYPVDGGEVRAVRGAASADMPLQFSAGDRGLYVYQQEIGANVQIIDLATGRKDLWKKIMPPDPAGVLFYGLSGLLLTSDGKGYFYNYDRMLSELYLVDGMR